MKKVFYLLSLFSGLLFIPLFSQAFSQQELVQQLQQPANVQGDFIQQRFLRALPKPISTQGKFVLLTNQGLLWQMEKPFANQMRVKADGISQWNGSQWLANGNVAQNEQIRLFLGLLSGNVEALKSQFDLDLQGNAQNWQLRLTPNSLLMKQIFVDIELQGGANVQQIQLRETQGDRTLIQFQQVQQNQPLSAFARQALQ